MLSIISIVFLFGPVVAVCLASLIFPRFSGHSFPRGWPSFCRPRRSCHEFIPHIFNREKSPGSSAAEKRPRIRPKSDCGESEKVPFRVRERSEASFNARFAAPSRDDRVLISTSRLHFSRCGESFSCGLFHLCIPAAHRTGVCNFKREGNASSLALRICNLCAFFDKFRRNRDTSLQSFLTNLPISSLGQQEFEWAVRPGFPPTSCDPYFMEDSLFSLLGYHLHTFLARSTGLSLDTTTLIALGLVIVAITLIYRFFFADRLYVQLRERQVLQIKDAIQKLALRTDDLSAKLGILQANYAKQLAHMAKHIKILEEKYGAFGKGAPLTLATEYDEKLRAKVIQLEETITKISHTPSGELIVGEPAENSPEQSGPGEITSQPSAADSERDLQGKRQLAKALSPICAKITEQLREAFRKAPDDAAALSHELNTVLGEFALDLAVQENLCDFKSFKKPPTLPKKLHIVRKKLAEELTSSLQRVRAELPAKRRAPPKPRVIVVTGPCHPGGSTTVLSLAQHLSRAKTKVLLGICRALRSEDYDLFAEWSQRTAIAVAFGGAQGKSKRLVSRVIHRAQDEKFDAVIIDAPSALNSEYDLEDEFLDVCKTIRREIPSAPHDLLWETDLSGSVSPEDLPLVLEENLRLTGVIGSNIERITKPGLILKLTRELKLPVNYISFGRGELDFAEFSPQEFAEALFGLNHSHKTEANPESNEVNGGGKANRHD